MDREIDCGCPGAATAGYCDWCWTPPAPAPMDREIDCGCPGAATAGYCDWCWTPPAPAPAPAAEAEFPDWCGNCHTEHSSGNICPYCSWDDSGASL